MTGHELCEACRKTFVPVSCPKVLGKRLCSKCAPKKLARARNEKTALSRSRKMPRRVPA
ncbi:hypothetical protein [Methanosarcina sp. KYL-1]|uniref:hypothetical protein n=1 Tax=Methanosarcina sp. KYL-1 TaxID=2602068 RepID=UPI002100B03E|nr:hypothetical protein [Methanosarcina sp. KYL-1]